MFRFWIPTVPVKNGFGRFPTLSSCSAASHDGHGCGLVAGVVRGADFVGICRSGAFGAAYLNLISPCLEESDLAKITDHIRQDVVPGVADFIQKLQKQNSNQEVNSSSMLLH